MYVVLSCFSQFINLTEDFRMYYFTEMVTVFQKKQRRLAINE